MTFWDDLKNMLIGVVGIKGAASIIGDFVGRATGDEEVSDLSSSESISNMADASIRGKSEIFSVVPNILGMPLLNDLYSPGFGRLVRRRVESAYKANLLSPMDYITYMKRFPEKEFDLTYYLSELGYNDKHEEILTDLFNYYPNAQDFVRFGVREVFKPDIVRKYGYDNEFPEEIKPHMHKTGLTDDVMSWFWRAHWELPSFYNIREARWRGVVTDVEVDEWLLANDYAPYWRGKLKEIMYNPYTRVDVRRMYDSGVITRDEVKKSYQDIGYDDSHAENLTKWTIINSDKSKDVLSTYTKAYSKDMITSDELIAVMEGMEYSDKEIELRIAMIDSVEVAERPKKGLTLTNVKKLFNKGLIDSFTLEDMLIELNYDDDAVKYMKILILSESQPYKEWVAEIKKGYKSDLLTRDETVDKLSALGYTLEAINLSLALIDVKRGDD